MIPPIEPIRAASQIAFDRVEQKPAPGFEEGLGNALQSLSDAEKYADAVATDIATGGSSSVHDLMIATSKASLSLELAVQVRNRALEAYQEIMRMQI
ncbi:MAG TPA: flagellar hook-basal body complex protein FliE [Acidimicrobiia bacterium]|jgi:flagellar hook-basal body complex protein FliE